MRDPRQTRGLGTLMPTRRCEYASFDEAAATDLMMGHVDELRTIQPDELSEVRD